MKHRNWCLIISSILLLAYCSSAFAGNPAAGLLALYTETTPGLVTIEPYMVSILALNEVENGRNAEKVRDFILWYLKRLNYPDRYGFTGTIYIYDIVDGVERPTNRYDSIDGYAGMFLHLLHKYVMKTGDLELLQQHWDRIEDIAYLLAALQGPDGLTYALPDSGIKYLMDNCEAYGGLSAYMAMQKLMGRHEHAYYSQVRAAIKSAIFVRLYDADSATFAWAIEDNYKSKASWRRYYPDAYAQLFPIYYGLLADQPKLESRLWRTFNGRYGGKARAFPLEQRIIYELTKKKMEG